MLYIIALEECCQDSTCAEGVGLKGDQQDDRGGLSVLRTDQVVVEVRDQVARKVHDFAGSDSYFDIGLTGIGEGWFVEQKNDNAITRFGV